MSVSILTPKAFSIRNAIVPDRSDRPLRKGGQSGAGYSDDLGGGRYG